MKKLTRIAILAALCVAGTGAALVGSADAAPSAESIAALELARMKDKLKNFDANCTGWLSPPFQNYVEEDLLDRPLFTPRMREMMEFVGDKKLNYVKTIVDIKLKKRLKDPGEVEARRKLIEIAADPLWSKAQLHSSAMVSLWCKYAGEGCSAEEFQSLQASISDTLVARNFELGRNVTLAQTDPVAAMKSTLAHFNRQRSGASSMLQHVIDKLPADADFATLEGLLTTERKVDSSIHFHRANLFHKWGEFDHEAAAKHVVSHPDRIQPEMFQYLLTSFASKQPAEAYEWIQGYATGPYFDAGATSVVAQIREDSPHEATQLANRISDPKLRAKVLEEIRAYNSPGPR